MQVTYTGGPRGLALLVANFEAEGLTVNYEPPMEERGGATQLAVQVVIYVAETFADNAKNAAATGAILVAVKKAIAKAKDRLPGLDAEVNEDD